MSNELDFSSLKPLEFPFEYERVQYKLVEPSAAAVRKFRNEASKGMTVKDGKVQGSVSDPGKLEILLVSLCVKKEDGSYVPEKTIEDWPSRMVKQLHTKAFSIAGLKETDTEEQLRKALEAAGSPVSYSSLKEYVQTLDKKEYGNLQGLFEDLGEDPKN